MSNHLATHVVALDVDALGGCPYVVGAQRIHRRLRGKQDVVVKADEKRATLIGREP